MTLLQHHILACFLTAITTFGLGLLVFLAEPKRRLNQIFGLYSLAIFWWAYMEALLVGTIDQKTADFLSYLEWPLGVIWIAPTFLHTVFLSTEQQGKCAKRILWIAYLCSFGFAAFHLFTPFLTASPRPVGYVHFHNKLTPIGWVIPFAFLIFVNLALWKLWNSYRKATGQNRTQLKYLFWASLVGYLGGSPDWLLVFGLYLPGFNPFGIYFVPMYSIATTYAVVHHQLFDVHIVMRKSLVYSLLVTALTVGYFGLVHGVERLFQTTFGYHSLGLSIVSFALMALIFQPLKIGIQRVVDWAFFRAPHEEIVKRMERLEQETRQTEKLKAVATLAAGMAHEIKNPLTSLKTFTEYLPHKYDDPDFREKFTRIVTQEVEKINTLVQNLLEFAKPTPPKKQPVHLSRLLDETIELLHGKLVSKQIQIVRTYSERDEVCVDPAQIKQALLNILLNSLEALEKPGSIRVTTVSANGHLDTIVADTGRGIEEKDLPHIFDPFYTTKSNGTGLGLSIVHGIVKEHGGSVVVDSKPNYGTTIRIRLPHYQR